MYKRFKDQKISWWTLESCKLTGSAIILLCINMPVLSGALYYPQDVNQFFEVTWLAFSRQLWVFGTCLIIFELLMNQRDNRYLAKSCLSSRCNRLFARCIPVMSLMLVSICKLWQTTDLAEPEGKQLTYSFLMLNGGNKVIMSYSSIVLMVYLFTPLKLIFKQKW